MQFECVHEQTRTKVVCLFSTNFATKLVEVQSSPGKVPHHRPEFLCANTMVAIVLLNVSVTLGDANGWLKHLLRKYTPCSVPTVTTPARYISLSRIGLLFFIEQF